MTLVDVGPDNWRHCAALEVEMTLLNMLKRHRCW
jgi:hypothetical protein